MLAYCLPVGRVLFCPILWGRRIATDVFVRFVCVDDFSSATLVERRSNSHSNRSATTVGSLLLIMSKHDKAILALMKEGFGFINQGNESEAAIAYQECLALALEHSRAQHVVTCYTILAQLNCARKIID